MKGYTALAIVVAFAAIFLFVGIYGYARPGDTCSNDFDCDFGAGEFCDTFGTCSIPPVCGNGAVEAGEQCDDLNKGSCPLQCSTSCTINDCGTSGGLTGHRNNIGRHVSLQGQNAARPFESECRFCRPHKIRYYRADLRINQCRHNRFIFVKDGNSADKCSLPRRKDIVQRRHLPGELSV